MDDLPVSWKAVGVAAWLAALLGMGVAVAVFRVERLVRAAPPQRATETTPFPRSIPLVK